MSKVHLILLLVVQALYSAQDTGREDLPGHLKPLGAHMAPELVKKLDHLPSPREFYEEYVVHKTPVIFEGALMNSSVWRMWQDDHYLREHFGEAEVGIEEGKKENRSDPRYMLTMNQFLDRYREDDIYLVDSLTPGMYQEWLLPRPLICGGFVDNFMYTYMWFSSGGTKSVLHTDSSENMHCLVSGRKEFVLMEPQYCDLIGPEHAQKSVYDVDVEKVDMSIFPALSQIPWHQAVVNEGDCLYLPYKWIHNVNSYGRNMGINIWWNPFEFNASDCPPAETQLPEYFPLADVNLSPEMMVMEALRFTARQDNSVHAHELRTKLQQAPEGWGFIEPYVEEMFNLLEPGCNGVITNYKSIPKSRIKKAYEYVLNQGSEEDDEFEEQKLDNSDYDHVTERSGDHGSENYRHGDEL